MSMYLRCILLHLWVMSVLYILIMDGALTLLWFRTWNFLFITNERRSDVEPTGSWWLDFWYVSFGMSVIHSDVEPLDYWWFDFRTLISWLMEGLFSPSLWFISITHIQLLMQKSHLRMIISPYGHSGGCIYLSNI